jgi:NAD(P)-dependent dehydrogenase (short-subunit alcohol dehydrogenase family)
MTTVVVTGADRGIGAALVRCYHARGDRAIAACLGGGRDLATEGLEVAPGVDVTDLASLEALAERIADTRVDLLISNAGSFHGDAYDQAGFDAMLRLYDVNALGPLRLVRALEGRMGEGGRIGIVTSRVGSISDNSSGGMYGYRLSKCAANQLGVNLYHEFRPRGIAVMLLHPGQVATQMTVGLQGADTLEFITPQESAVGLVRQLDRLGPDTPPEFRHTNGALLPW